MDEAKKKELEELRKQIDPTILSNMMKYLGDDDNGSSASSQSVMSVVENAIPAEKQRSDRARAFQERVRRRKMLEQANLTKADVESPKVYKEPVFAFCSSPVWLQIMQNHIRQFGFIEVKPFRQLKDLLVIMIPILKMQSHKIPVVAVSGKDIVPFIIEWEGLKRSHLDKEVHELLIQVHVLFIIAEHEQASDELQHYFGRNHVLCIKDSREVNCEKLDQIFNREEI